MSKKKKKKSQIKADLNVQTEVEKAEEVNVEVKTDEGKNEEVKPEEIKEEAKNRIEEVKAKEISSQEQVIEKKVRTRFWTKKRLLIADLVSIILLVTMDQVIKYFATVMLENRGSVVLIEDVLQLTYLKNTGGILGVLQNQTLFIMFIVVVLIMIVIYLLTRLPDKPKFNIMHTVLSCLLAGALGNMLDRIRFGYVVDFIYFIGIDFPIFNCADILISLSTIIMLFLLVIYYKENDLEFLTFKQKRYRVLK